MLNAHTQSVTATGEERKMKKAENIYGGYNKKFLCDICNNRDAFLFCFPSDLSDTQSFCKECFSKLQELKFKFPSYSLIEDA